MTTITRPCPRCRVEIPEAVQHRDDAHCLDTLIGRYAILSREYKRLKKSVDFVESKVSEWKARAKHAEAELIAIQGAGERSHEQRLMQLEQRVKFLIGEQRDMGPDKRRKTVGREAA